MLEDIQQIKGRGKTPVIVMTEFGSECLDLTTELFANGAWDFISKPFPSKGRTLRSVIRKVLDRNPQRPVGKQPPSATSFPPTTPFDGGEMVFHPDRITLCDVTILVNSRAKQMRDPR